MLLHSILLLLLGYAIYLHYKRKENGKNEGEMH